VEARDVLAGHPAATCLGEAVQKVFEPNRGARFKVDDARYGVPFLSSSEVFAFDPRGDYLISRRTPHFEMLPVTENDLLLPRSGQLGGVIGRAVLPLATNYGHAASEHLVRVRCHSREDAYYLWAVFASQPGYYATIGTAFGSSIPSLDCDLLADLHVPWMGDEVRRSLVTDVTSIQQNLVQAIQFERQAVANVEAELERLGAR
jgi:type I restriction enzyme S subunit